MHKPATLIAFAVAALGAAAAATDSLPPDLAGLPWLQVTIGIAISAWGGATATIGRYISSAYGNVPFYWRPEAVKDFLASGTVGAGAYFAGSTYRISAPEIAVLLLISGYLGVRLLGALADRLLAMARGTLPPG